MAIVRGRERHARCDEHDIAVDEIWNNEEADAGDERDQLLLLLAIDEICAAHDCGEDADGDCRGVHGWLSRPRDPCA